MDNYLILVDKTARTALKEHGIRTALLGTIPSFTVGKFGGPQHAQICNSRVAVIAHILRLGYEVIWSDTDVVFMRDFYPMLMHAAKTNKVPMDKGTAIGVLESPPPPDPPAPISETSHPKRSSRKSSSSSSVLTSATPAGVEVPCTSWDYLINYYVNHSNAAFYYLKSNERTIRMIDNWAICLGIMQNNKAADQDALNFLVDLHLTPQRYNRIRGLGVYVYEASKNKQ